MASKIFMVPFALSGDKQAIPDALQPDGSVSFTQGFGFDYERPNTDPLYKPFPRDPYNWLVGAMTEAIGEIQRQGVATWSADGAPYALNAQVWHDGVQYRSTIAANETAPGINTDWADVRALATSAVPGLAQLATVAQTQAGLSSVLSVTPEGLAAATPGRLLSVQVFDTAGTSTYTPTPGTKSVIVDAVAGGGGSGAATSTVANQQSFNSGGGGGAYGRGRFLSDFAGVTVTVGAAGAGGAVGNPGLIGGSSSFGSLLSVSGGQPSGVAFPVGAVSSIAGAQGGLTITGANIVAVPGSQAASVLSAAIGFISSNLGGASGYGASRFPGGGAPGRFISQSSAAQPGFSGYGGLVIVWEYA